MTQVEDIGAQVSQQAGAALQAVIMAATQVATVIVQARAQKARELAEQRNEQARQYRATLEQQRGYASEVWRRAERNDWWRRAQPADIQRLWESAAAWQHIDPRAADTLGSIRGRLAEMGVQVEDPRTPPGDAAWIREAVNLAAEERMARQSSRGPQGRAQEGATAEADAGDPVARPSEERNLHATAVYQRLNEQDQESIAASVRDGWPDRAEDLITCQAWPALAGRIWERGQAGHDMAETVRLLSQNDISNARRPAALACWMFDRMELRDFRTGGVVISGEVVEPKKEQGARQNAAPQQPRQGPLTPAEVQAAFAASETLREAATLITESQFGSAAMLIRKMRVGFTESGHLMDQLEQCGVVGPEPASRGARDVLMSLEQLGQLLGTSTGSEQSPPTTEAGSNSPFGQVRPSEVELDGMRWAAGASGEQVKAAAMAYWTEQRTEAKAAAAAAAHGGPRDGYVHAAADRVIFIDNQIKGYQGNDMTPYWHLGREAPEARAGILAQLQASTGPATAPSPTPVAATANTAAASSVPAQPTASTAVPPASGTAQVAATAGEIAAAAKIASGYPTPAVAAAAASTAAVGGAQPTAAPTTAAQRPPARPQQTADAGR